MAIEIIMPKFGFTQESAEIVSWMVKEGDRVEKGDPICEVTTDKVNMEVEAPDDGIISGFRYDVGAVVPVTEVIAYLLAEGESAPASATAASAPATAAAPARGEGAQMAPLTTPADATPIARRIAEEAGIDLGSVQGSGPKGRITREDVERHLVGGNGGSHVSLVSGKLRATPAARRIAAERAIDLAVVGGSGPRGRIQEADVLAYQPAASAAISAPAAQPAMPAPVASPAGGYEVMPLVGMRRTIATRLQASYQQAPHIMFTVSVDMTAAIRLREDANAHLREGQGKVSMTAVIFKAVAWALRQHRGMNAHLVGDEIRLLGDVNIGMAVALPDGLIVPVIQHVDQKGLITLGQEINDAATRARTGKLKATDLIDGSFSVSNMGMFGIDHFTSIINPPQVGILAVGQTKKEFVVGLDEQPLVKPIMKMTLSADHRAVDGAQAGGFITAVREALEEPQRLIL